MRKNKNIKQVVVREGGFLTREKLEDPHIEIPRNERLVKSGAIDLRENHTIIDLDNRYVQIVPIDPNKKIKLEDKT